MQFSCKSGKLISKNSDLALGDFNFFITALKRFSNFDELSVFGLDLLLSFLIRLLFSLKTTQVLLMLILFAFEPTLGIAILDTSLVDQLVTTSAVFNSVLPLQVKFVSLLMQPFEFFGSLVKFDLSSLGLGYFLLELVSFTSNLNSELLDLEGELLDLGLISAAELLERRKIA